MRRTTAVKDAGEPHQQPEEESKRLREVVFFWYKEVEKESGWNRAGTARKHQC